MACIIYTAKPAVSRKVGHAGACVLGDCVILYPMVDTHIFLMDAYLHKFKLLIFMSVDFIDCLVHSCYTPGRIAQSVVYRLHDQNIVGSILDTIQKYFFPSENVRNNILNYGAYSK